MTMKIALIIPTLSLGGAERIMSQLATEFANRGHHVDLILLAKSKRFFSVSEEVNIIEMGFENKGFVRKKLSEFSVFMKLQRYFHMNKPEVAMSFMEKYNLLTILTSLFTSTKIFVSDRSNPLKKQPFAIELGRSLLYRFADGIISQTELSRDVLFRKTTHRNIKVIANPVKDFKDFSGIKKEKIILNSGRLVNEKGQKLLIDAFSLVDRKDWKLVILGDGYLKSELESRVSELELSERVILKGSVDDVEKWLGKASIFAFSSISEGYPNALLEAMSVGLPCVSFDCNAGPRDLIKHGENGFLVLEGDVKEFAKYLTILIDDEVKRNSIGKVAIKIKERHQLGQIATEYLDFFRYANVNGVPVSQLDF